MSKKSKHKRRTNAKQHRTGKQHFGEQEREAEFAADLAQVPVLTRDDERDSRHAESEVDAEREDQSISHGVGWTALIISILSLFIYPGLLGPAGAIVGFIAYRQGSRSLGIWAMALGVISLFVALLLSPFF